MNTEAEIQMKMTEVWRQLDAVTPKYMMVGAINYAMLNAHVQFADRDRRRIKREVNKAARKARAAMRAAVKRLREENKWLTGSPTGQFGGGRI
jgi:hypothetical protein